MSKVSSNLAEDFIKSERQNDNQDQSRVDQEPCNHPISAVVTLPHKYDGPDKGRKFKWCRDCKRRIGWSEPPLTITRTGDMSSEELNKVFNDEA